MYILFFIYLTQKCEVKLKNVVAICNALLRKSSWRSLSGVPINVMYFYENHLHSVELVSQRNDGNDHDSKALIWKHVDFIIK